LEQLASAMASQLGQSGQPLAGQLAASGGTVPPSWAAVASGNGSPSGSSAGGASGSPSEPGSGAAPGSSGASGSGGDPSSSGAGAGAGAGSGTGAGAGAGQGAGSGSGSGQGGLQGGTGAGGRTLVTTPRTMAGEGNVQEDGGPSTGGQEQTGGKSPMIDGMTRPYEEVYSEYATEAKKTLGRSQLPQAMQDKVKQYFDNIQPNR
ncbi:phage tail tape measure protein, partial [Paenibacillus algorifonticola]